MRREKTLKAIVEPRAARAILNAALRHAEPLVNAKHQRSLNARPAMAVAPRGECATMAALHG
jgi:hypothetical protein